MPASPVRIPVPSDRIAKICSPYGLPPTGSQLDGNSTVPVTSSGAWRGMSTVHAPAKPGMQLSKGRSAGRWVRGRRQRCGGTTAAARPISGWRRRVLGIPKLRRPGSGERRHDQLVVTRTPSAQRKFGGYAYGAMTSACRGGAGTPLGAGRPAISPRLAAAGTRLLARRQLLHAGGLTRCRGTSSRGCER
jgi:hypothetical protein